MFGCLELIHEVRFDTHTIATTDINDRKIEIHFHTHNTLQTQLRIGIAAALHAHNTIGFDAMRSRCMSEKRTHTHTIEKHETFRTEAARVGKLDSNGDGQWQSVEICVGCWLRFFPSLWHKKIFFIFFLIILLGPQRRLSLTSPNSWSI